jgi:hypothetical protein
MAEHVRSLARSSNGAWYHQALCWFRLVLNLDSSLSEDALIFKIRTHLRKRILVLRTNPGAISVHPESRLIAKTDALWRFQSTIPIPQ